jgi:hypothetical protein
VSEQNPWSSVLEFLETVTKIITSIPEPHDRRGKHDKDELKASKKRRVPEAIPAHHRVVPRSVKVLRSYLTTLFETHHLALLSLGYFLILAINFAFSPLAALLILTVVVLFAVVIYEYDHPDFPIPYRGIRGAALRALLWILCTTAITTPLFSPVMLINGLVTWIADFL